jgi:single-strand DNA-binding protein
MRFNKVIIGGFVGKDPDVKYLEGSGKAVAQFNLAVDESYTDKSGNKVEQTEWFRVVAWDKTAELVEKYVKKGSALLIEGRLKTETYEDQKVIMPDGAFLKRSMTKVIATVIQFAGSKPEQAHAVGDTGITAQNNAAAKPAMATASNGFPEMGSPDDDLPF